MLKNVKDNYFSYWDGVGESTKTSHKKPYIKICKIYTTLK